MKRVITALAVVAFPTVFAVAQPAKEPYSPGLGEFMAATQLRHAKLWFAGKAKNWALAGYEIDEIKEGLEDAAKQVPTHDGFAIADMIRANTLGPLEELEKAVDGKSSAKFVAAFDKLTTGCNACHAAVKKEFIKIQRPSAPPLSNQIFAPGKS